MKFEDAFVTQVVEFNKGDGSVIEGAISRKWNNGKYVTIMVDDTHTYVRVIDNVNPSQALETWRKSHGIS